MPRRDFSMTIGDDKIIRVPVTEQDDGSATDITGATIVWIAKKSKRKDAVISKTTADSSITIADATGGVFEITLEDTDTATLLPGDYLHEAQITFSDGRVATVLRGVMTLEIGLN